MPRFINLASAYPEVRRKLELWSGHRALSQVLEQVDHLDIFLAGGAIRDCFLEIDRPAKDFDFFLNGPSLQPALEVFAQHGSVTQTPYGAPRWYPAADPECYADLIPIADFQPGLWQCEDIVDVLNQFDFTASALAFDLRTGASFDPQNGFRDVTRKIMRMVRFDFPEGPFIPGAGLNRTAILWFRILHYAKVLGLVVEPLTLQWLRARSAFREQAETFASLFFPPHRGYLDPL